MVAPDLEVLFSDGSRSPLSSLYASQPLTLVFLRHLGCPFCREQVASLRFGNALNIAFACMADVDQAEAFRTAHRSPHPFICDPEKTLYRAFGLERATARQLLTKEVFSRGFGAVLRGHWIGKPIGDPWQLPGIFRIETNGTVSWEHRGRTIADNLELDAVRQSASALHEEP